MQRQQILCEPRIFVDNTTSDPDAISYLHYMDATILKAAADIYSRDIDLSGYSRSIFHTLQPLRQIITIDRITKWLREFLKIPFKALHVHLRDSVPSVLRAHV